MKMKTETRGDFFISIIILGAVGGWSAGWRGEEEKTFKEEIPLDNLLAMGERGRRGVGGEDCSNNTWSQFDSCGRRSGGGGCGAAADLQSGDINTSVIITFTFTSGKLLLLHTVDAHTRTRARPTTYVSVVVQPV